MGWRGADRHGMRCDEQAQTAVVGELIIPTSAQLNSFQARACHIVVFLSKVPYQVEWIANCGRRARANKTTRNYELDENKNQKQNRCYCPGVVRD